MFGNFLMKSLIKSKLKDVPPEMQDKIINAIEKNPDFFTTIAKKVEERVKNGESQQSAMMTVMREHQSELQKMMQ